MMDVFRVSPCRFVNDHSGTGAAIYGGRWNSKGIYVLYASLTPSLALLENIVHLSGIPLEEYCLVKWNIPEGKIAELKVDDLPPDWASYPSPDKLKEIGDEFIRVNFFLGLKLPSAIMPEENIILLNPQHPDFKKIKTGDIRNITFDARLFSKTPT